MTFYSSVLRAIVASVIGGAIYYFLPGRVITLDDDFGYLRSVVSTIQRGRPWTDDWLEPWTASFSWFSSALYHLSGSFHFATYGLLGILGGLSIWAIVRLFEERKLPVAAAWGCGLLVVTCPTIFWKEMEFTGVALHLPCLFLAIYFADKKQWAAFLAVFFVAAANRQSAAAWLVIPAIEFALNLFKRNHDRSQSWRKPFLVTIAGAIAIGLISLAMNKTHAQTVITDHSLEHFDLAQARRTGAIGAIVFLLAAGIGNFLQLLASPVTSFRNRPMRWQNFVIPAAGVLLFFADGRPFISREHPGLDLGIYSSIYLKSALLVSIVGWLLPNPNLQFRKIFFAAAALGPLLLRQDIWDYYLLDVALFGLFLFDSGPVKGTVTDRVLHIWKLTSRAVVAGILLALVGLQLFADREIMHRVVNQGEAMCTMTEHALRSKKLTLTEIGHAPVGYMGWYFFPYFAAHEGRNDPNLSGFVQYVKGALRGYASPVSRTRDGILLPANFRSEEFGLVDTILQPIAWFSFQQFGLRRVAPSAEPAALPPGIAVNSFPLSDQEWSELIERKGRWSANK